MFRRLRTYLAEKLKSNAKETTIENSSMFPVILDITSHAINTLPVNGLTVNGLTTNGYCVTFNRYSVIANG